MSDTLEQITGLVARGEVRISDHGYDELAEDSLFVRDLIDGLLQADLLEDYPAFPKGPCVLILQKNADASPIHVVWGIPKGESGPAVLITAYRPDPEKWSSDFRRRNK